MSPDAVPLIMTKIRIPRRRSDLVPRRRLVDFIHAHLDRRLILISAPAGYGKTTLLTDFAHETDLPVCWFTLDPFDRDLSVFLEHLVATLAHRFPAFGARTRAFLQNVSDPGQNLYPLVATLVQEVYATIPEYFVLVLDDHHTVEEQEQISEFLGLLLTYADENLHLILASRTLPALPNLSLLVARRQAAGLSIDELRFTAPEIQALALQNYGIRIDEEQAAILAQRTGGWITGLLLTAAPAWQQARREVSIQGRINIQLYDYLSKQVLDQQPPPLREFLLDSSILEELNPEICREVLGIERAADFLDQLRIRNLFVTEFEGEQNYLRYHDLFREFLQTSLRRQDEARFREITLRAAQAYAARGEWERAVSRYLVLQDHESVAQIVERMATHLYETGRKDTLASWLDALSDSIFVSRPHFWVHRGRIYADRGEYTPAMDCYQRAEQSFAARGDRAGVASVLATKGHLLRFQGRYSEAVSLSRQALAQISGETVREKFIQAMAYRNDGLCQLRLGSPDEGREALRRALTLYQALADPYDEGMVHHDLGLSYELAGDLEQAVEHYQAALRCWQELGNPGPWANTLNSLGVVHALRGEYEQALRLLTEALTKAQQAVDLRVEAYIWASLGDVHRDLGAYEQARQAYSEALQVAHRAQSGFVISYSLNALGMLCLWRGDRAQARACLSQALEQARAHESLYEVALCHLSLGVLAGEEGDERAAQDHLERAIQGFRRGGFRQELARALLQRAGLAFQFEDRETARNDLVEALALAEQLGFDQFLVVDGARLQPLLYYGVQQGIGGCYLPDLLRRIEAYRTSVAHRPEPALPAEPQLKLSIYALGAPRVELDGKPVQWTTVQSRDLLYCLLLHPEGLRKEEIGGKFWPEHDPVRLDGIFRSTLYRLRRTLFRESVIFEDGLYRFNWETNYWFDVEAFEQLVDQAEEVCSRDRLEGIQRLEKALALYRGEYLEGVGYEWCVLERERLHRRFLTALETLARLYADQRELEQAIEVYQRLLAQDPYREAVYRELMLCYYRLGDRAAAIRKYQECVRVLREELGLSPDPETERVYLDIIH